jgi:tRNA-dihydrouridine synthase
MIGREIMNNPWVFAERENISKEERIKTLLDYLKLYEKTWKGTKPYNAQKKYIKMFISDFDGANEIRQQLMSFNNVDETYAFLSSLL